MAKTDTFQCSVITPERAVLECDANFVAFPAHDGERGVLRNHAPLVCRMGIGRLRVETPGQKHRMFVDGGFAQIVGNTVTILTEQAIPSDKIDRAAASAALDAARALKIGDDDSLKARTDAIRRAHTQLALSKS